MSAFEVLRLLLRNQTESRPSAWEADGLHRRLLQICSVYGGVDLASRSFVIDKDVRPPKLAYDNYQGS
jgi:hypothetical protein